jgi:cytochrome c oxidase assembly protein subunit 15
MRVPRVSPLFLRRLTTLNVVLLLAVVVSGAIVRVSSSGLGCRDWPNCSSSEFVSVATDHAAIEQINRIFSGLIGIPLVLTLVAVYQLRPRRGDLLLRAWILVALFLSEAVVGGISVHLELAWFSVMSHFLLALALVSIALQIRQRVREPAGPRAPIVAPPAVWLVRVMYGWTIGVLVLGTLVTAAGPHGGDREAKRIGVPITDLARTHAVAVDILVVLTLVTVVVLVRTRAPRIVLSTASFALGAMVAQGVLGYVQYAEEVPAVLVGFHVFGAVLVFTAVQQLALAITGPLRWGPSGVLDAPASDRRVPVGG